MNMQAGKVSLACLCRLLRLKLSSCASWQYRISTIAEMQHRSLVQTRVAAATQFARHASVQRHKIASCAALKRVAATGGAAAGGTVTAPQAPDISTSTRQEPSRVTAATVEDIKGFHKSQLHEYDYVVEDSMVSSRA
jgi:hypothetical protein